MPDDSFLLRRYAETHAEADFAAVVHRHLNGVYSAALRRVGGDAHLAEDVSQNVFLELARQAAAVADHPALTGWLYTLTRNEAANVVRRERRRKKYEQAAHVMNEILAPTGPEPDWNRVAPVLDAAIDGLSESDRTAVLLRFVDRRAFGEIGAALRVSEDAARMRVERALTKLRDALARRGIASSAVALGLALANHAVVAAPGALAANIAGAAVAMTGPAVAGSALKTFGFMTTTKTFLGLAALLALGAALFTANRAIEKHRATTTALAGANRENELLLVQRALLEKRLREVGSNTARLRLSIADARVGGTPSARKTPPAAGLAATPPAAKEDAPWDPLAEGKAFIARHPEVKDALGAYGRARSKFRFAPFYARVNLTPRQMEQFETLMAMGSAMGADGPDGSASFRELSLPVADEIDWPARQRRLNELLGPEGYRELVDYQSGEEAREIAVSVAGALWFTDTPLTPAQSDQLATLLMQNHVTDQEGKTTHFDGFNWTAVIAESAYFLAPAQIAVLQGMQAHEKFTQAINRKTLAGLPPASKANAVPAK